MIFVIGFPKAGTSSIQYAFDCAEIKTLHWARYNLPKKESHLGHVWRGEKPAACIGMLVKWAKQDGVPLLTYMPGYEAFTQMDVSLSERLNYWPQLEDVPILDQQYPNSKFIFNTRPIHKWISSVNRWGTLRKRLIKLDIPGLPPGAGAKDEELELWHDWHKDNMVQYFADKPGKLLVFDIENDNPQNLADFLGLKSIVWEKKNSNPRI